ncbi:MAG TPA: GtrA family protein [Spirochaetia bacterium]|nr:GtrA family protein [Spirochaetia bacterium]
MEHSPSATNKGVIRLSFVKYKSLLRFMIVGSINTGIDFLLFVFLMRVVGVNYLIAQTASYAFGVMNSFIMNKAWTFGNTMPAESIPKQFVQFLTLNILSLLISLVGLKTLTGYLGVNILLAKMMVTVITWSVRYIGYKYWVFEGKRSLKGCGNL